MSRSSNGSVIYDGSNLFKHPGYPVDVVDSVGASDAFIAGFLAGILEHHTVHEFFSLESQIRQNILFRAIDIANVCGASVCTKHGDTASMPTMEQVTEFLDTYGSKTAML